LLKKKLLLSEFLLNSELLLFSSQSCCFLSRDGVRDESHDLRP